MNRATQAVLALAVFIGTGYITRAWFSDWMNTVIKDSEKQTAKEMEKWKATAPKFDGIKFDKPIQLVPKYEPIKFQPKPAPMPTVKPPKR